MQPQNLSYGGVAEACLRALAVRPLFLDGVWSLRPRRALPERIRQVCRAEPTHLTWTAPFPGWHTSLAPCLPSSSRGAGQNHGLVLRVATDAPRTTALRSAGRTVQRTYVAQAQRQADDAAPLQAQLSRRSMSVLPLMLGAGLSLPQKSHAAVSGTVDKAGDWSSPGLNAPENENLPKFFKTSSGVKVQEIDVGKAGRVAAQGDLVLFDYVLRRSNGYFIYGTVEGVSFQPKDVPVGPIAFRLGDSTLIYGLQEALTGMSEGAKRRVLIPPEVGYLDCNKDEPQPPTFATRRQLTNHCKEPLLFEIQLLRITRP